jgi:multiple sugar transport system permease protein/raffinose/stachyose/melibiose transport system permease protein
MKEKNLKLMSYTILTGPGLLIYTAVIIFPIFFSLILSFTDWAGFVPMLSSRFTGLSQYLTMIKDPVFWFGLRNNLLIVGVSVFGQIPLGFVLAYILYRRLVAGGKFFETMIFLPITINPVVLALLWDHIFGPAGILTALLRMINHNPRMVFTVFEDKTWAIFPILFVILWVWTGLYMVIFIANLQKISPSIIEAAVIDGATEWQVLGRVIIPSMIGILFTTGVFAISGSLASFNLIYAMTGGGPAHYTEVIAIYQYNKFFTGYHYGYGSAISVVIVLLSVGLISILNQFFSRLEKRFAS